MFSIWAGLNLIHGLMRVKFYEIDIWARMWWKDKWTSLILWIELMSSKWWLKHKDLVRSLYQRVLDNNSDGSCQVYQRRKGFQIEYLSSDEDQLWRNGFQIWYKPKWISKRHEIGGSDLKVYFEELSKWRASRCAEVLC